MVSAMDNSDGEDTDGVAIKRSRVVLTKAVNQDSAKPERRPSVDFSRLAARAMAAAGAASSGGRSAGNAPAAKRPRPAVVQKAAAQDKDQTQPRPAAAGPVMGGFAGRILQSLGQGRRPEARPAARPATKLAPAKGRLKAPAPSRASEVQRSHRAPSPKLGHLEVLRSASPCSAEPPRKRPTQRPAPARGKASKRPQRSESSSPSRESSDSDDASESPAPVPKARPPSPKPQKKPKAGKTQAAARPAKKQRTAAAAKSVTKPPRAATTSPEGPEAVGPSPGTAPSRPVISASDEGSFQAAVLERLRSLCGEHEDAKVLAEYIVVMVAGSKGREEMAVELKPFFQDQAQAESFVDWVEECKFKFLTGQRNFPTPGRSHGADSFWAPAPVRTAPKSAPKEAPKEAPAKARLTPKEAPATAHAAAVRPGPNVAVTSRAVLQPNPQFDAGHAAQAASSSTAPAPQAASGSPAGSSAASLSSPGPPGNPVKRETLLENMTKQLQLILTKLNDKTLNDAMREKYQMLAQNIQVQMAKISKPQAAARRR